MDENRRIANYSPEGDDKFTTIYIISKGRPQCRSAVMLTEMRYPGNWFIVCGTNDETVGEYIERWGEDRVLIFDWEEEVQHTQLLDNFGVEKMGSGASPVRNAVIRISKERGELRHWQLDDDYEHFYISNPHNMTHKRVDGKMLFRWFNLLGRYAQATGMSNVGVGLGASRGAIPENWFGIQKRVFNVHCLASGFSEEWRGRMNDDVINALDTYRKGRCEMSFCFMQVCMALTQSEEGGLTEMYRELGTVRKTAYAVLVSPKVKLVVRFGRFHHKVQWSRIAVKIINEKWKKVRLSNRRCGLVWVRIREGNDGCGVSVPRHRQEVWNRRKLQVQQVQWSGHALVWCAYIPHKQQGGVGVCAQVH